LARNWWIPGRCGSSPLWAGRAGAGLSRRMGVLADLGDPLAADPALSLDLDRRWSGIPVDRLILGNAARIHLLWHGLGLRSGGWCDGRRLGAAAGHLGWPSRWIESRWYHCLDSRNWGSSGHGRRAHSAGVGRLRLVVLASARIRDGLDR